MERSPDQVLQYMVEVEGAAEDILADRQQIVDLDRRRQQGRQALRSVYKTQDHEKLWVCFGSMFIKLPKHKTKAILQKDFDKLDHEINSIRNGLKTKVNHLKDLEQKEELKGFHLESLSRDELRSVEDVL